MYKHIKKAIQPIRLILNDSRVTGILLIICTLLSVLFSNATQTHAYQLFWHKNFFKTSSAVLPANPLEWINTAMMSFFFLLAGMEIKRELLNGELSSFKKAILPFGAALGGMVMPAILYAVFNHASGHLSGWGIPTATDIAFSLGIASIIGKRFPVGLKIFLMALAIIDDLGAIVIVTLFYGGKINLFFLAAAGILYSILIILNILKIKNIFLYIIIPIALWYCMYRSGIEAGITGVLVAFALPVNFLPSVEKAIHFPVNYLILPLFALANTAIILPDNLFNHMISPISMGIIVGLVIGKPLGIYLFSRILVYFKIAHLPAKTNWTQLIGMGTLAGIGFTMSIFTTTLAFKNQEFKEEATVAIMLAMCLSFIISSIYFFVLDIRKIKLTRTQQILNSSASNEWIISQN
ncbi:MAG: Na+/H+ antiporter NhaA [Sphingobacteriales bacterium]|uniref:Na+/H+ antiporter NhaA n=1 Tax=Hydrotalea flava TaxID=714549 RepID=UPI00082E06A5|nr:Na+/H+ antiporter NhaA [Hydrotalea flava]RTL55029.1 MAG: Na+/H+ antiporter NhaA [Sphingobacteriales bacterium]